MNTIPIENRDRTQLSAADFRRLSGFIRNDFGINLTESKKVLLETRLRKRLASTKSATYADYVDFLFTEEGMKSELVHMVDAICTNKTDFFRESAHFDLLSTTLLPQLLASGFGDTRRGRPLRVWSAACSTGEEPFTLAMVLSEFQLANPQFDFSILASDISTRVLDHAQRAVYGEERIDPVPEGLRRRYLRRGRRDFEGMVRVVPALRDKVEFRRVNLTDRTWSADCLFDVAFLRNVIIYFDRETRRQVVDQVVRQIRPGGYLFVGHSETLFEMDLPIEMVQPTVYRRIG